jgi:hypothetical protein
MQNRNSFDGFARATCALLAAALICGFAQGASAQADKAAGSGWITATNQPCKIWNPEPQPNESVTWSGQCVDGLASGKGVLRWTEDGKPDIEFDGTYARGKRNGAGVLVTPDGHRIVGEWVDDLPVIRGGKTI